jgi:hypothetical protein
MGPRAVLDAVVKRKIPSSSRESNPRIPIVQPIKWLIIFNTYSDVALPAIDLQNKILYTTFQHITNINDKCTLHGLTQLLAMQNVRF